MAEPHFECCCAFGCRPGKEHRNLSTRPNSTINRIAKGCERRLRAAEDTYRARGLPADIAGPLTAEVVRRHLQAAMGAAMVGNSKALLAAERLRLEAAGVGLSNADKVKRLTELRATILKAAARRELALRKIEGAEFMPRPVHPELAIYRQGQVERLAR
jgi:hypothetical protein